jgi:ABC-2 type transport system permease protein
MRTVFLYALNRMRGQVIGWGLVFLLLGWPLVSVYDMMMEQKENMQKMLEQFKEFAGGLAPKNINITRIDSPDTFLSLRYFAFMPLIFGVYAVINGSGLLAADEENGTLDLVLAHPVSRTGLFLGRLLAFLAVTLFILAVAWVGLVIPMSGTALQDKLSLGQAALPFLSLLALLLFFGTLALLLSMVLPSRRLAAMTTGFILLAGFFFSAFARASSAAQADPLTGARGEAAGPTALEVIARFSPLDYYQGGEAVNGLNWAWFVALMAPAVLFTALAWWRFERRDIRVAGEGGWQWPWLRRNRKAEEKSQAGL